MTDNPLSPMVSGALGMYSGLQRGGIGGAQRAASGASGVLSGLGQMTGSQGMGQLSNYAGGAGNALGVLSGLQRGGVGGYGGAAINAAQLANRAGFGSPGLNSTIGGLGNSLGIYNGLRQGGVTGYGNAAINTAQLGSRLGVLSPGIGTAAGYLAAPLAVYNAANNWKSGDTGNDALQGASAGAAIGSVVPVVGTALGALIGGAVGAASSAFGPGKNDPETLGWNQYAAAYDKNPSAFQGYSNPTQDYQNLAGIFDARGSQIPFYGKYGRMGEGRFLQGMTDQINSALAQGTISKSDNAQSIYNKVVQPWITSMSPKGWQDTKTVRGASEKAPIQHLLTNMIGEYVSGQQGNWKGVDNSVPQVTAFGTAPAAPPSASQQALSFSVGHPHSRNFMIPIVRGGAMMRNHGGRVHYDDGGSVDYYTPDYSFDWLNPSVGQSGLVDPYLPGMDPNTQSQDQYISGYQPQLGPIFDPNNPYANAAPGDIAPSQLTDPYAAIGSGLGDMSQWGDAQLMDSLGMLSPAGQQQAYGGGGSGVLSGLSSILPGRLGTAWSGLNTAQQAGILAGLASLVGNIGNNSGGANMTANYSPTPPQMFQGSGPQSSNMYGNFTSTPRQQTNPQGIDYAHYGQGPATNFFTHHAQGGAIGYSPLAVGDALNQSGQSRHVKGPGDGTSDDIDAKLSDGEYVIDANTVSMLGNGSNEAGARKLDQMRRNLRKHAAKPMKKGKQFMKAREPATYMEEEPA